MADTAKSGGHLLTDEELHRVQSIFLEMAKEVDEVCRRHHICMMLSGGSVIGAVRHKGFIPWDDDLDINIPRKDYNRFLRIFDRCAELGLIVSAHSGFDIGIPGVNHCSPAMSAHVMKEIPSLCLILAHMGGWHIWDEVPAYLAGTGAYLDTSFSTGRFHPLADGYWNEEDTAMLNTEGFMRLVNAIGPDHILFGTDSPWSVPEESIAFIREAPLSEADKAAILGGTACRLLFKD